MKKTVTLGLGHCALGWHLLAGMGLESTTAVPAAIADSRRWQYYCYCWMRL